MGLRAHHTIRILLLAYAILYGYPRSEVQALDMTLVDDNSGNKSERVGPYLESRIKFCLSGRYKTNLQALHVPVIGFVRMLALIAVIGSCAGPQIRDDGCGQKMSPRQEFERIYQADSQNRVLQTETEYLTWVVSFYNGQDIFRSGWETVELTVLKGTEEQRRGHRQDKI